MILLLVPPKIMNIDRDIGTNQLTVPGGLAYIAGYLKKNGVNVAVLDAQAEKLTLPQMVSRIQTLKPDIVGIGIHCSVQINEAHAAARAVKQISKNIPVIVGGSHPSAIPEKTLTGHEYFDFIVTGEGEVTAHELYARLKNKTRYDSLEGIAFRASGGNITINKPRPYIEDLDTLPFPAFELFPLTRYKPYFASGKHTRELPVTTARGCPSKCFFCYQPMSDAVRMRSVKNVMEELHYLTERFGVNQILFTDDTFTLNIERIHNFCDTLRDQGLHKKIQWLCASRVDIISQDLLRKMRASGCTCITYGVESGNQDILDKIKKNITLEQARNAVQWTKEAGIRADVNFILGLPFENEKTIRDTQKFMLSLDSDFVNIALLAVFPGTRAQEMAEKHVGGLKFINQDWYKAGRIVGNMVELEQLPRAKLEFFQTQAYMKFYLRPRKIKNLIRKVDLKTLCHYCLHQVKTHITYWKRTVNQ
ncbi:MAG: radical SAM protein [Candidatus Omnitrophica bacterium]|nr:radical SAM protein [Candidatus Omnitrophota bacterium]